MQNKTGCEWLLRLARAPIDRSPRLFPICITTRWIEAETSSARFFPSQLFLCERQQRKSKVFPPSNSRLLRDRGLKNET